MEIKLSKRVQKLSPSLTMEISNLARVLKSEGKDILSFSAGEPDFDTPEVIKKAAIEALHFGHTKYTAVAGIPEVKKAIVAKLKHDNNLYYDEDSVVVSVGAKHSLFNIFQAILNEGDEVIIPSPYWVTYPEIVKYSDGVPVIIKTDESTGFKITKEQLSKAITPKTKAIILTTPSNPTGAIYSKDELVELSKVLEDTNIVVISDEMYEKLVYNDLEFCSVASISDDMFDRTITVNGLSKSVAMTGWRFGYLATPNKELVKTIIKLQSQSTSNINSITQHAAIAALSGTIDEDIYIMRQEFEKRRDLAVDMLNSIKGISVLKPDGAFYLFVNISKIEKDSLKFCKELLEQEGIAVVPGIGFGSDGYFRFSFATDEVSIKKGIERIEKFVKNNY